MRVEKLIKIIGADFYTGIPDSLLKALCDYLMNIYGIDPNHHIIAANEGNCTALAAGYHLATGKVPVVYLQNSGEGNIINPIASLLNDKVYAIPMIFIVGWRGEEGVNDEPQHVYQGKITLKLLENMDVRVFVISKETIDEEVENAMEEFRRILKRGKNVAFVIRKDAITYGKKVKYKNDYSMMREEVIKHIVKVSGENPIISTTGKVSRELFEIREANNQSHKYDFLTVGSMGHSSSIALGIAINKSDTKIWCIDGDGAVLMHMGALAVMGTISPPNVIHIVINNGAHETVGGMPTVASKVNLTEIAKACGYQNVVCVDNFVDLDNILESAKKKKELSFIEIRCSIGSRKELGRPTIKPEKNKEDFMNYLQENQ